MQRNQKTDYFPPDLQRMSSNGVSQQPQHAENDLKVNLANSAVQHNCVNSKQSLVPSCYGGGNQKQRHQAR